jgi:BASS family bile acid:Na+ symporter
LLQVFEAAPLISVGFFILAVCPGAPVGPTFTGLAKGDVPLATGAMVVLGALSAVAAPALITLHLHWLSPAKDLEFDCLAIIKVLLVTQLLPLGVGLAVRSAAPRFSGAAAKPMSQLANVLLLVLVGLIVATEYEMLQSVRLRGWCGMLLLLAASLAIGWFCGGTQATNRRAMAATTGVRNAAVGLAIASANFPNTPAVTAVIAYGVLSIFGTLAFAWFVGRGGASRSVEAR